MIPQKEYEALRESFGDKNTTLTQEMIDSYNGYNTHLEPYLGQEVYESFTLTRDMIENATSEQLIAINNFFKSAYELNMYGKQNTDFNATSE